MRPPLRVGIVVSSLGLLPGGTETRAVQLALQLSRRGHQVWLAGGRWPRRRLPRPLAESGLEVIRIPVPPADWRVWRVLGGLTEFRAFSWQRRIFQGLAQLSPRLRRRTREADVTFTLHVRDTLWMSRRRRRLGKAHVSYFTGGSRRLADQDASQVRVANPRVLDPGHPSGQSGFDGVFQPGIPQRLLDDESYQVRPRARRLLFVGRLEHNNGPLDVLEIFSLLSRDLPDLQLSYVGRGVQSEATRRAAKRKGLLDRISFTGTLEQEEVWEHMKGADVLVMPLRHGHFPITLLEAAALGLPLATSDIPGVRNGCAPESLKLPLDQPAIWARELARLLGDEKRRRHMSQSGRLFAAPFTWERAAAEMEEMFYLALDRAASP